jgi:hypothetical protein
MSGPKWIELLKHLNVISLSVPIGILLVSILFPLQPVVQQALVGILLVWFGVELMTGFPLWR